MLAYPYTKGNIYSQLIIHYLKVLLTYKVNKINKINIGL